MEKQVFYSKIGGVYVFALLLVVVVLGYLLIVCFSWLALVLDMVIVGIVGMVGVNTKYTLYNDGRLDVVCGFLPSRFDVKNAVSVRPTRSILSAPAASLDRLEVKFKKGQPLVVSPRDKQGICGRIEGGQSGNKGRRIIAVVRKWDGYRQLAVRRREVMKC